METYVEIMKKLNVNDQKHIDLFMRVLTDKLSRKVLAKLASPNTPLSSNDLPLKTLEGSKIATLTRFHQLEEIGLVNSKMVFKNDGYYMVYHATPLGQTAVGQYMTEEASLF
jgi:ferric iron reductase protein FhuF